MSLAARDSAIGRSTKPPMCQTPIQAIDTIEIDAEPAEVWRVLVDISNYPSWWPHLLRLRLISAGREALGSEVEIRPFGGQPFYCRVEEVRELQSIRLRYFGGGVEGQGEWRIESHRQGTRVSYRLDVLARGRLVRVISKVVSLADFHSRSMRGVLKNLEQVVRRQQR